MSESTTAAPDASAKPALLAAVVYRDPNLSMRLLHEMILIRAGQLEDTKYYGRYGHAPSTVARGLIEPPTPTDLILFASLLCCGSAGMLCGKAVLEGSDPAWTSAPTLAKDALVDEPALQALLDSAPKLIWLKLVIPNSKPAADEHSEGRVPEDYAFEIVTTPEHFRKFAHPLVMDEREASELLAQLLDICLRMSPNAVGSLLLTAAPKVEKDLRPPRVGGVVVMDKAMPSALLDRALIAHSGFADSQAELLRDKVQRPTGLLNAQGEPIMKMPFIVTRSKNKPKNC